MFRGPVALLVQSHPAGMLPVMLPTPTRPAAPRLTASGHGAGRDGTGRHRADLRGQTCQYPPATGRGVLTNRLCHELAATISLQSLKVSSFKSSYAPPNDRAALVLLISAASSVPFTGISQSRYSTTDW
jgi:hypothetical protein